MSSAQSVSIADVVIRVKNLTKSFPVPHQRHWRVRDYFVAPLRGDTYEVLRVLDDVSFALHKAEWIGVIGNNGSGKSTLLKILAGVYQPDTGTTQVAAQVVPLLELRVGFHPDLSVRDNIFLNGVLLGLSRREVKQKVPEILGFAQVEQFVDQRLRHLSTGMQVRLAVAVALHVPGDLYLLDEVLAASDYEFRQKIFTVFRQKRALGISAILVSHDMNQVEQYCDRVLWLKDGKIARLGLPESVISEYIADVKRPH